jgi:hypothetical protein
MHDKHNSHIHGLTMYVSMQLLIDIKKLAAALALMPA